MTIFNPLTAGEEAYNAAQEFLFTSEVILVPRQGGNLMDIFRQDNTSDKILILDVGPKEHFSS